ncbi:MAG: hypothetical protein HY922_14270 [Elusimicrobia bacterium]|nr:hypothetical protein [Elusimicrobiota bacterium]
MDEPIDTFEAREGLELGELCRVLNRPCGKEFVIGGKEAPPQCPILRLEKTTPRGILDAITHRYPDYHWIVQNGVIVLEPQKRAGKDLLARKVGHVSIHGKSSYFAAHTVLTQAKLSEGEGISMYFGPAYRYARIDLELHNITVREALNAIAKADGQVLWLFAPIDPEKLYARYRLISWRMSGITIDDEQVESCPTITRWRIKLVRKWGIDTGRIDWTRCDPDFR